MREQTWFSRRPTATHEQWFRNLVDLNELTNAWIKQLQQTERATHSMSRGVGADITDQMWMLGWLGNQGLESLLDDTLPDDTLGRLDRTVWAVQGLALGSLHSKSGANKQALDTQLEQIAWKQGRLGAEMRWPRLAKSGKAGLREAFHAFAHSPLSGYPHRDGFLIKRALSDEILVELRACPHRSHYPEVAPVADRLCRLHAHWMRGFAYALNSKTSLEHVIQEPRCVQRWHLI